MNRVLELEGLADLEREKTIRHLQNCGREREGVGEPNEHATSQGWSVRRDGEGNGGWGDRQVRNLHGRGNEELQRHSGLLVDYVDVCLWCFSGPFLLPYQFGTKWLHPKLFIHSISWDAEWECCIACQGQYENSRWAVGQKGCKLWQRKPRKPEALPPPKHTEILRVGSFV